MMALVAALIAAFLLRPGPASLRDALRSTGVSSGGCSRTVPTRLANAGYLGHMWELYAMWAWAPVLLLESWRQAGAPPETGRLAGFAVVAAGAIGCVLAGRWADRIGRTIVTSGSMIVSGTCALVAGLLFDHPALLTVLCLVWGFAVVADSAQFSAAVSELTDSRYVGTALAVQTALGFLLTLVTIRFIPAAGRSVRVALGLRGAGAGARSGVLGMLRLRALPEAMARWPPEGASRSGSRRAVEGSRRASSMWLDSLRPRPSTHFDPLRPRQQCRISPRSIPRSSTSSSPSSSSVWAIRVASLFLWPTWTRPAGTALLILSTLASVAAVQSGKDAHGPVERIPGARDIVEHHEEKGEQARNLMLVIAAIEILGLAGLASKPSIQKAAHVVSAVGGLYVGYVLYEAAEHGGEIVYEYGGGPGLRSGDTTHMRQALVAGLYNQAQRDREAGRSEEAARLTDELVRRMPGDQSVAFLAVESRIKDRHDPQGALADLAAMSFPADQSRLAIRHALLTAEALEGGRDAGFGERDPGIAQAEVSRQSRSAAGDRRNEAVSSEQ